MIGEYPPVGFHFMVGFQLIPQGPEDFKFQEVSGLNVDLTFENYIEGGENRFTHQLPLRTKYADLSLKRGVAPITSGIYHWVRNSIEFFHFQPINLTVSLLNELHVPIASWYVVGAVPKRWQVSNFNAEQGSIAIETLQLSYQYFKTIRLVF